jgi:hypothetical protein
VKYLIIPVLFAVTVSSCHRKEKTIVDPAYVDSLIKNYTPSETARMNEGDLSFWKKRMDSLPDNYVNGPKYASALALRFRLYGNIHDLLKADSLLKQSNAANQEKEDGLLYTLANLATLQHHFKESYDYAQKGVNAGDNKYGGKMAIFDATFELGQYDVAGGIIRTIKPDNTYPYYFRRSKYEHYHSSLDTAISYMLKAAASSQGNKYLEQAAISNAADLYIHAGNLQRSYDLFRKSIAIDAADFHSIMGIGWIALMHDNNDSLAKKIFEFAHSHLLSPDPLLKLMYVFQQQKDSVHEKKMANEFIAEASQPEYGQMYNKYLIDIYTSVLNNPQRAVELAKKETESRPTPQTYAWYAWALLKNNEKENAGSIFSEFVSGKPLEGLELYYMGKLMQESGKGYNAREFFKAAWKNHYDLSPAQITDLGKSME